MTSKLLIAYGVLAAGSVLAAENMLKNPGFENGADEWRRVTADVRIADGEGYQGGKALVWENEDSQSHKFPDQVVELEPGHIYRFTGLVRKDRFSGADRDIFVGLEWNLRSGKWGGSCYGKPVDDNGILRDGWVRFEGTTAPMPSDVGKGSFILATAKQTVGRLRFDDVTLEGREVKCVEFLTTDAYRNVISREKVRFLAALHLDVTKHALSDYAATLSYRTVKGENVTVPADTLTAEEAVFVLDGKAIAKGAQDVRFEVRRAGLGQPLGEATLRFTRLEQPLRRRVTYDAAHRMRLDGKPFFPVGMYTGHMSDEDLEIYGKSPFNFATQYGGMTMWDLNHWEKIGVLAAADVRSLIYGYDYSAKSRYKTLAESQEALRRKYAEIGDSPALLMWYLNDEAPVSLVENIANVQDFLHEVDPERATLTCLCHPETALSFLPTFDVLAHDCYPIGWKKGKEKIEYVWDNMRKSDETMRAMRPLWFIPQAFNWKWYTTEATRRQYGIGEQRMPTREEMLNMNWQGIAAGANGILMYSFSALRKNLSKEEFGVVWADIVAVAAELKKMERVILADPVAVDASSLPKALVSRAWTLEGRDVYLVVNRTREAARGMLSLPSHVSSLKGILGSGVTLAKGGAGLAIDLPALGYAFVQVIK